MLTNANRPTYVVITAARNEERFIPMTITSLLDQTLPPLQWVIVDDGSTDGTSHLLREVSSPRDWITVVRRPDRGHDQAGFGIAEALHDGLAALSVEDYTYLAIVDADVSFGTDFFERLLAVFESEPQLGMAGGLGYERIGGRLVPMDQSGDTVFGATRVYRRTCFEDIGGIEIAWGWDAIDETKARMSGWAARTIPELGFEHLKRQHLGDKFEHGVSAYVMGSSLVYVCARSLWRMARPPYVFGGVLLFAGYVSAAVRRLERVGDREYRRALRKEQTGRAASRLRSMFGATSGAGVAGTQPEAGFENDPAPSGQDPR